MLINIWNSSSKFGRMRFVVIVLLANVGFHVNILGQGRISKSEVLRDMQVLSHDSLQGRRTATEGAAIALKYLTERFAENGLAPVNNSFHHAFKFQAGNNEIEGINIVGEVPGKSQDALVITAHYDHEGIKNGEIYNGADDNASGTSAILALAKYFKENPVNHRLIFVAFDAEELGLQGARAFVASPPIPKSNIKLNINFDMISHNDENEIYAVGTYHYPQFKPVLQNVGENSNVKLLFGHDQPDLGLNDWTFSSDHGPFHQAKIPFLYFGVDDHKDYHKPTDDFENINQDFYINVIEMLIDAIVALDKQLAG